MNTIKIPLKNNPQTSKKPKESQRIARSSRIQKRKGSPKDPMLSVWDAFDMIPDHGYRDE